MGDALVLLHTAIAIVGIIVLIVVVRLNPVIVLVVGSLYLGIATGLGYEETVSVVAQGFGDLMAEVGLIIGFGVLLGALLAATGSLQKIVESLLTLFGSRGSPYAFSLSTAILFPAIYFDVTLMILGPLARSVARRTGGLQIAMIGGALAAGLEVGLLLVLPGAALLAVAGVLNVPLGTMLLYGLLVGIPTILLTTALYIQLVKRGLWNIETDETSFQDDREQDETVTEQEPEKLPSLFAALLPILIPVLLIILATATEAVGLQLGVISFLGSPIVALLLGLLAAYLLASRRLSTNEVEDALTEGLKTSGLILLFTGVAGCLGAVIAETGIADIISGLFSARALSPILLVWVVAAFLRVAQGSATVAAITSAGIVAPIVSDLGTAPVLIALAAGSGAAFAAHVNDNSFWLFNTLLGLSTKGTFKIYTLPQSMVAVISLVLILLVALVV